MAVTILVIENHRYAVDADADRFAERSANPQPPASSTPVAGHHRQRHAGDTALAHHRLHRRADTARRRADGDRFAYPAWVCTGGPHGISCPAGRLARRGGCSTTISYYHGYMVRVRSTSVKALSATEIEEQGVDPLFMVWLVSRSTNDLLDTVVGPAGLTGDEFAIYSVLAASPGITPASSVGGWPHHPPRCPAT